MVANGSEPREILLDPMIAGSRGADGCEFDREVDRECGRRVDSLVMVDSVEEPVRNSAAIADATGEAAVASLGAMRLYPADAGDEPGEEEAAKSPMCLL